MPSERKGEIAVSDRAAEFAIGARHVHMDPLVVAGGLGELVHPFLGDLKPIGNADFLSHEAGQVLDIDRGHERPSLLLCKSCSSRAPACEAADAGRLWPVPRR